MITKSSDRKRRGGAVHELLVDGWHPRGRVELQATTQAWQSVEGPSQHSNGSRWRVKANVTAAAGIGSVAAVLVQSPARSEREIVTIFEGCRPSKTFIAGAQFQLELGVDESLDGEDAS